MQISVNGEPKEVPDGATVERLLDLIEVQRQQIAVEVNRELVPRSQHAARALAEGDVIEIVTLVGGG